MHTEAVSAQTGQLGKQVLHGQLRSGGLRRFEQRLEVQTHPPSDSRSLLIT